MKTVIAFAITGVVLGGMLAMIVAMLWTSPGARLAVEFLAELIFGFCAFNWALGTVMDYFSERARR